MRRALDQTFLEQSGVGADFDIVLEQLIDEVLANTLHYFTDGNFQDLPIFAKGSSKIMAVEVVKSSRGGIAPLCLL